MLAEGVLPGKIVHPEYGMRYEPHRIQGVSANDQQHNDLYARITHGAITHRACDAGVRASARRHGRTTGPPLN